MQPGAQLKNRCVKMYWSPFWTLELEKDVRATVSDHSVKFTKKWFSELDVFQCSIENCSGQPRAITTDRGDSVANGTAARSNSRENN
jgi:hypothetical protein